jgi:cysteine desulfurase
MIYLDYQATTPLAPEARAAMLPWLEERFGNPHSPHRMGREAAAAVAVARARIAAPFAGEPGRLLFTSGATEAANWALKGAAMAAPEGRRGIVTIATEHACVLDSVGWLAGQGFDVTLLPVGGDGLVDVDRAAAAIDGNTLLVAAMLVNNEIGVVQPIAALSRLAREAGALFFCDAVQGYGRVPVPVAACDMIAISAHKIHGPKGIGALWLRDGVTIVPLLHGGGQEGGIRSGTLSPALCAGFGAAAALAAERMEADAAHVEALWAHARGGLEGWTLNGAASPRWHGNLNIRHAGLDAARLISDLRGLAFSAGSACASGSGRPSHVLRAIGLTDAEARASIRLGFGRYTTSEEIDAAMTMIRDSAQRQRAWAA